MEDDPSRTYPGSRKGKAAERLEDSEPGSDTMNTTPIASSTKRGRPLKSFDKMQTAQSPPPAPSPRAEKRRKKDAELTGDDLAFKRAGDADRSRKYQILTKLRLTDAWMGADEEEQQTMEERAIADLDEHRDKKGQSSRAKVPDQLETMSDFLAESSAQEGLAHSTDGSPDSGFDVSDGAWARSEDENRAVVDQDSLRAMTVIELRDLATASAISLSGLRLKADIIRAIVAATAWDESDVEEEQSEGEDVGSVREADDSGEVEDEDEVKEAGDEDTGGEDEPTDSKAGGEEAGGEDASSDSELDMNPLRLSKKKQARYHNFFVAEKGLLGYLIRAEKGAEQKYSVTGEDRHKRRWDEAKRDVMKFNKTLEQDREEAEAKQASFAIPEIDEGEDADDEGEGGDQDTKS